MAFLGHEVTVATIDAPDSSYVSSRGFTYLKLGPGFGNFSFSIRFYLWLYRNIKSFDVVLLHGIWQWPSFALRLVPSARGKVFCMPHGSLDVWDRKQKQIKFLIKKIYFRLVERPIYKRADQILFTSSAEMSAAKAQFYFRGLKASITPYGAMPIGEPRLYLAESDEFTFGYLGRIHEKKGIDTLIESFANVLNKFPDRRSQLKLRIAGDGELNYVNSLKHLASQLRVSNEIEWVGTVTGESKANMLRSIGVFVLPSHQENFGLAVAEALSAGTPVILSKYVNICDVVEEAGAGWIAERTVNDFTSLMCAWVDDLHKVKDIRSHARNCFDSNFSLSSFVDHVIGLGRL